MLSAAVGQNPRYKFGSRFWYGDDVLDNCLRVDVYTA